MTAQVHQLADQKSPSQSAPHSIEAEEGVLGGCLLDESMVDRALEILKPADFYRQAHRTIMIAFADLRGRGSPVDLTTTADILRGRNELGDIGGATYLADLIERVPTAANVPYYAQIVRRDAQRRQIIAGARELALTMRDNGAPLSESLPAALEPLLNIDLTVRGRQSLGAAVVQTISRLEEEASGARKVGVTTGLYGLDTRLGGYCRGTYIVIAGRPSMGKSSLSDTSALAQLREGHRVGVVSLETSREKYLRRLFAKVAKVDLSRMKQGRLNPDELRRLSLAAEEVAEWPLEIADDESTRSDWATVQVVIRRMVGEGAEVIYIDHLGLIELPGKFQPAEKVKQITRQTKRLAEQLDIPLVQLVQINREAAKPMRKNQHQPGMHNLRESGTIEQDADDIILLHRPWYYDKTKDASLCEAIIAKQRDGAVGVVELRFIGETAQFADYHQEALF
ncbi:MAG: DnaB-like helicase C-terminal domain-containing protein [Deltaproteobacteria bacterium]|nr:DnaB-like helicase C-terminal domain-containing protein [Deltaproteobacteria bacterium]